MARATTAASDGGAAGHAAARGRTRPLRTWSSTSDTVVALSSGRVPFHDWGTFERGLHPAGVGRQLRAILASGSRKERLAKVKAPTLVIHGTVDPLVRPEGGKDTAASIPGAKLLMIEGMGHALPIPMWPQIIDAIDKHAHGAKK